MSRPLVARPTDVEPDTWSDPVRGEVRFRTVVGQAGASADFTAGVTELEPGGWLGHHRHEPAEIYYVVRGRGTLTIDGEEHRLGAGSVVHIPSKCEHAVRNTGDELLQFFFAFAVGSIEEIEYHFTAERERA